MRRRTGAALFVLVVAIGAAASTGGGEAPAVAAGERPRIVATTSIVEDVVAQVGGDGVDLTGLLNSGQNPHDYEPTARTLGELSEAQIIFVSGLGLEESLLEVLRESTNGTIVPVSDGIEPRDFSVVTRNAVDPHAWMSPINVKVWVENIRATLVSLNPASASIYEQNASVYLRQLDELDLFIRSAVSVIPPDRRELVTGHRVFGYFADEYGFEQVGFVVPGSSTGAEATAKELADLVELIRARNVPAIFVGVTAGPWLKQLAESVAGEAGGDVRVLPVLTGSLAPAGQPGDTYLGFIRFNVEQIIAGLGDE
ncbi:MAG: metal ABC transporter substrate-binding protein [Spirochaetia bacterium]